MENDLRDLLQQGCLVRYRRGDLRKVEITKIDGVLLVDQRGAIGRLTNYTSELTNKFSCLDIMEVWGRPISAVPGVVKNFFEISTDNRELLWKREESKKMTVAEIEAELGYPVEIISGVKE